MKIKEIEGVNLLNLETQPAQSGNKLGQSGKRYLVKMENNLVNLEKVHFSPIFIGVLKKCKITCKLKAGMVFWKILPKGVGQFGKNLVNLETRKWKTLFKITNFIFTTWSIWKQQS